MYTLLPSHGLGDGGALVGSHDGSLAHVWKNGWIEQAAVYLNDARILELQALQVTSGH